MDVRCDTIGLPLFFAGKHGEHALARIRSVCPAFPNNRANHLPS